VTESDYLVVRNDEEQYSVWERRSPVPPGWYPDGFDGSKQACLDHIDEVWTDMRPASVRTAAQPVAP
jgi:MbtH protein